MHGYIYAYAKHREIEYQKHINTYRIGIEGEPRSLPQFRKRIVPFYSGGVSPCRIRKKERKERNFRLEFERRFKKFLLNLPILSFNLVAIESHPLSESFLISALIDVLFNQ